MLDKTDIILFGAEGDLSGRKLFPALYHLHNTGHLPEDLRIAAVARQARDKDAFLTFLKPRLMAAVGDRAWSDESWQALAGCFSFIQADFTNCEDYQMLSDWLDDGRVSIFYLATPPSLYGDICQNLQAASCLGGSARIVLEKPIGHDLASCRQVNNTVAEYFPEDAIYRIDHYLGKETVQNLLVLRFANRFINAQWDNSCIDHVQITVAETVGIEDRWSYYDQVGQLKDMVQNHLIQLLCMVAMEPPNTLTADDIRNEKIKILNALRPIDDANVKEQVVRGQYASGWVQGEAVPGYHEESGCVDKNSDTETYIAIKTFIDNWRWSGVPFYLRTGKRLPEKLTEIIIEYKSLPHNIFSKGDNIPNKLVIRLQPNEGINMQMVSKQQSLKNKLALATQDLNLDFLDGSGQERIPDAYERLFLDIINGDQSLFVGKEEVEASWQWCDQLLAAVNQQALSCKSYHAGSWGPSKAEMLIERDRRSWHE